MRLSQLWLSAFSFRIFSYNHSANLYYLQIGNVRQKRRRCFTQAVLRRVIMPHSFPAILPLKYDSHHHRLNYHFPYCVYAITISAHSCINLFCTRNVLLSCMINTCIVLFQLSFLPAKYFFFVFMIFVISKSIEPSIWNSYGERNGSTNKTSSWFQAVQTLTW